MDLSAPVFWHNHLHFLVSKAVVDLHSMMSYIASSGPLP